MNSRKKGKRQNVLAYQALLSRKENSPHFAAEVMHDVREAFILHI